MKDTTLDLFSSNQVRPGSLGCPAEVMATIAGAMKRAAARGISREEIASRMSEYLGEKISVATINGFTAPSHTVHAGERGVPERRISMMQAMAFDAAVEEDALIGLYAGKLGGRAIISQEDQQLLEWAKLHREEKALAERKKELEAVMKSKGGRK